MKDMERNNLYFDLDSSIEQFLSHENNSLIELFDNIETPPEINSQSTIENIDLNQNTPSKNKHDKYTIDNMIKKWKALIAKKMIEFLNLKISLEADSDEKLYDINAKIKINPSIKVNKILLNTNLGDFFSNDISDTNNKEHNKLLIQELKKNGNINKCLKVTYLDFIKKMRGDNLVGLNYDYLDGVEIYFDECIESLLMKGKDDLYINAMIYLIQNFESAFDKTWRKSFASLMKDPQNFQN